MTRACATCLAPSARIYCSLSCRRADEACMAIRTAALPPACVCYRLIEPDRVARGRKTCARCSERAAKRTMRIYQVLVSSKQCCRCRQPLDPASKSRTTCGECAVVHAIKGRQRRASTVSP